MNELMNFDFDGRSMRFGVDSSDTPFVVASDFAKALGYDRPQEAVRLLEDGEKGVQNMRTPGGDQQVSVIYEHGMWELVFRSTKPAAKALKQRVKEILTTIRKEGAYVSPTATEEQLALVISRAESQARVLTALQGVVSSDWLDAKGRVLAARALGEVPDLDPRTRPLSVSDYLAERGLSKREQKSVAPVFGRAVKSLYRQRYNADPGVIDREIDNVPRKVACYSERDRSLFDEVWGVLGHA